MASEADRSRWRRARRAVEVATRALWRTPGSEATGRAPSRSTPCALLALATLGALVLGPRAALADAAGKDVCVAAVEDGQVARYNGKLRAARDHFVVCARPECPGPIRNDCSQWLGEVDASLPSVVFSAQWSDGRDAFGVRVSVDGGAFEETATGRAVPLDPGAHVVAFELEGALPAKVDMLVHEGEKNRAIRVTLSPSASPPAVVDGPRASSGAKVTGAWILGGVAALAVGSGVYWYLSGRHELDTLRASCGHECNGGDVDAARRKLLFGDVSVGIGVLAAGALTWLILTPSDAPTTLSRPRVELLASPGGGRASLILTF